MSFRAQHPSIHNGDIASNPNYWRDMVTKNNPKNSTIFSGIKPHDNSFVSMIRRQQNWFGSRNSEAVLAIRELLERTSGKTILEKITAEVTNGSDSDANGKGKLITIEVEKKEDNLNKAMKERMRLYIEALTASILAETDGRVNLAKEILSSGGKETIEKLTLPEMNKLVSNMQNSKERELC